MLSVNASIKDARRREEAFDEIWREVNDPTTVAVRSANEKDSEGLMHGLLRGHVYTQGLNILRDLTKNHFSRQKPGFFARIFRTKAAREYAAELEEKQPQQAEQTAQPVKEEPRVNTGDPEFTDQLGIVTSQEVLPTNDAPANESPTNVAEFTGQQEGPDPMEHP